MSENVLHFPDEEFKEEQENKHSTQESIYNSKFSDVNGLNEKLVSQLKLLGYEKMTKVQEIVIPKILSGGDILLRAPTGTGKTLSFLVPAIQRSLLNEISKTTIQRGDGTIILILTPTRELCIQTIETARLIVQKLPWCVTGCICGGEKRKSEKARLRKGVTILGGTPGRILDHIDSTNCFKVSNLKTLIVDEADRLLEEGFGASYKKIYQFIMSKNTSPNSFEPYNEEEEDEELSLLLNVKVGQEKKFDQVNKQIILVSATLSKPVEDLARYSLKNNPEWLILDQYREIGHKMGDGELEMTHGSPDGSQCIPSKGLFTVPINLRQEYVIIQDKFRIPALISLLLSRTGNGKRTVLFVSSTQVVEFYFALLQSVRWPSKLLIAGGPKVKNSIKLLESFKRDIDSKDLRSETINDRKQDKFKSNKKKRFSNNQSESDSDLNTEEILSDSSSEFETRRNSKRSDNNNFQKGHRKWFTNSSQLVETFETMFDKYIFKNSIYDELEDEENSNSNYEKTFNNKNGDIVYINDSVTQPPIFMLHGHMNKEDRLGQLNSFEKSKKGGVIITSDVASRGLNFPKIDTVIQLDPPQSIEEYVHRMGRTARMGDKGTGIIFLRPSEEKYLETLKGYNITGKNGIIKLSDTTIWEGLISNNNNSGKIDDISGFFYSVINKIITLDPNDSHNELLNKARRAYIAYVRSYMSYDREFSNIFSVKKLHLGHVASSFGINEQPNKIIGHIKYLDGVISHKDKINIDNKANISRKQRQNFPQVLNKTVKKTVNKQITKIKKDTSIRKKSENKSNLKDFNFKSDPSKSGMIDKALLLMKNKNEIYVE